MIPTFSKVCIVGCGAIGGWLGAGLARANCQVSVFARGNTLTALQTHGLRMGAQQHPVRASANAADLGVQDLVVLSVKAPALQEVVRQITQRQLFIATVLNVNGNTAILNIGVKNSLHVGEPTG